jgi:catechol 2,3-dioxygenase-like lactoylglutathione lyase family enzyme
VLQHVSIEVPVDRVTAMLDFWGLLGFDQVEAPAEIMDFVTWLQRGDTQIHLLHTEEPTVPPLGHCAVVAEDFEDAVMRLRASGYEVEPAQELWGAPRAFAIAPAGHRVELMASSPVGNA